jgi:hypothetical protein
VAKVWIDMDGDGVFETNEYVRMLLNGPPPYTTGVSYAGTTRIPFSSGSSTIKYYFEFRDRADFPPAGGISTAISPATAIDAPDVLQTPGNTAPVIVESDPQTVIMDENGSPMPFSLTLNATDAQSDIIYWSISSPAAHGVATVGGTGTQKVISYSPNPGYSGTDSFVVRVYDYLGGTDTLTVNVNIEAVLDLTDAIKTLQVVSGIQPVTPVYKTGDVNGDGRIGLEEAIFVLQKISGLRP